MDYVFDPSPRRPHRATKPVQMLQASISGPRVYAWLAIQLLLGLAGMILLTIQRHCSRQVILDSPAAALVMDSTALLEHDTNGLTNMSYCTARDVATGRFSLGIRNVKETAPTEFRFTLVRSNSSEPLLDRYFNNPD